jgi:hypothetical protein
VSILRPEFEFCEDGGFRPPSKRLKTMTQFHSVVSLKCLLFFYWVKSTRDIIQMTLLDFVKVNTSYKPDKYFEADDTDTYTIYNIGSGPADDLNTELKNVGQ